MSYFMRYIVVDELPLTIDGVRRPFAAEEEDYAVDGADDLRPTLRATTKRTASS
ncbi:MAG TPA: hypothetical protein VGC79_33115 [Polyangiaceae bacterium]